MIVRRRGTYVEVSAPAKLNLFLEVLGKRPDGFHEIETVMTPVSLFDTLTVSPNDTGRIELECEQVAEAAGTDEKIVPTGPANIIVRALEALRRETGTAQGSKAVGARVHLTKRIPLAAGMAGGSTDAAAALAAANIAWNLNRSDEQLAAIAATLGSDIPFFFARKPALCTGRGERVRPLGPLPPLDFVVVAPPVGLSTADVYRACRPADRTAGGLATADSPSAEHLLAAWRKGDKAAVGRAVYNRLQQAAEKLSDWIARLAREMDRFACWGHRMSGSGTSYFALCRSARQARGMAAALAERGLGGTFALRSCTMP